MDRIQVQVLRPETINAAEDMMVLAARLTQRGQRMHDMSDLENLLAMPYTPTTVSKLAGLPHPTLQKFGTITIAIVGASRRFLAQITRHQNEVKFMSASLQYSDYSGEAQFVAPYEMLERENEDPELITDYLRVCNKSQQVYEEFVKDGCPHDAAAYLLPQGMRNTLLICASPYQWKHMIRQRVCRRNSSETRYVMLRCWEELARIAPEIFGDIEECGAFCQRCRCEEGPMSCGRPMSRSMGPGEILRQDYPLLYETFKVNPVSNTEDFFE